MNMFVSSENSAAAITLNSEKETLMPVGSFFDKIHCMCWTAHFSSFWKEYSENVNVNEKVSQALMNF